MEKRDLIIALHGFLGKPQDWDSQLKNYQKTDCKIVAPFFFEPSNWSPEKNISEWGQFFLEQCERWQNEGFKLKLLAYSLGGRLALGPFLKRPELFSEVHFFSVNPGLSNSKEKNIRQINDANWARKFLIEPWELVTQNWNLQPIFLDDYEPKRNEVDYSRELLARALTNWSISHQENYWDKLVNLKQSINWWVGGKDQKFLDIGTKLNQANKRIKLNIVPNCGHRVLFSNSMLLNG